MKVTVCIGSSCHLKGSRQIVEQFQALIAGGNLKDRVELGGAFCMGKCATGVSVMVGDAYHSLRPENAKSFFEETILKQLG
ncbi:MAG: (2Fe-2S) ferredoxin domain-containing protein [Treponema sp.]|jgi:NADH:ubiquinone oxidoreductase subunit E|nr:(2Fe-2S) ferredoxin domain-containing protein [Treponema sp.]